ncbi:MAG: hypothetical protein L3K01_04850 [Thermoplasmata archaeon]|nr:hypothetical protein [Thermoplasmata archaeon]
MALGAVLVFALLVVTMAPLPAAVTSANSFRGSSPTTSATFGNCNAIGTPIPSALLQGIPVPRTNVTPGGNLSADMEVMAANWTPAMSNITVHFPSVFFNFPKFTGGHQQLFLSNRSFVMNFSGWSNASLGETKNYTFPAGLQFKAHTKAVIDSMKIAVQATADYGQITLEVRWAWTYNPSPGTTVTSPWSVPTNQSHFPNSVPSIFWPAPYATFLNYSGLTSTIGTNWTATLGGDVSGRMFFLEMEFPSGGVVESFGQTAPLNLSTYTVMIPMENYNRYLVPGTYLVHIHDACGALLYSKTVHAVFPPTAQVTFYLTPAACAGHSITFNGTKYTNGTSGVFVPSTTAYSMSIEGCPGHTFHSWSTTGALHIATGKSMLVSNSGTFTVNYT